MTASAHFPHAGDHTSSARPYSVTPADEWIGYDGNWSPVTIRVGAPSQWVNLIPNTLTSETWVIGESGCRDYLECRADRGGTFHADDSSTWNQMGKDGMFEMGYTVQLEDRRAAYYGYDTISLDEETAVSGQVIGIYNQTDWWVGSLGLGATMSNFGSRTTLAFLHSLANESLIPSASYGYTAGAYNRLKHVPTSLTLGGFDQNRFVPNGVSFTLDSNDMPVLSIESVQMTMDITDSPMDGGSGFDGLIPPGSEYYFKIDSSTPFFWFPEHMCEAFARTFGLQYDEKLDLYLYGGNWTDDSYFDYLVEKNLILTFTLSDYPGSDLFVEIELPISAVDHKLTYPFNYPHGPKLADGGVRYFPLRKAKDPRQYTIGRTLLQEAYLIVDYERHNFSLSQAKFEPDAKSNMELVAIRPDTWVPPEEPRGSPMSIGAKAGIGIGALIVAILIALFTLLYRRRQERDEMDYDEEGNPKKRIPKCRWWEFRRRRKLGPVITELPADKRYPTEVPADASATRFELPDAPPAELPGSDIDEQYCLSKQHQSNQPSPYHGTLRVTTLGSITEDAVENPSSPSSLPPYSPEHVRPIDTTVSAPVSTFPSPLPANWTGDGSYSSAAPSPITATSAPSASGSYMPESQPPTLQSDFDNIATATRSPHSTRDFSKPSQSGTESVPSPQSTLPPQGPRRKFSWEE